MKLAYADGELRHGVERAGAKASGIRAGEIAYTRVGAEPGMQLVAPDVDRVNMRSAARQEHVREAAGRRADIDAGPAGWIDSEAIEGGCELYTAAGHPGIGWLGFDLCTRGHDLRRPHDAVPIDSHKTGFDRLSRLGPARAQSYGHQGEVEATGRYNDAVGRTAAQAGVPARLMPRGRAVACSIPSTFITVSTMPLASSPACAYMISGLSWSI